MKNTLLLLFCSLFFIVSCETAPQIEENYRTLDQKAKFAKESESLFLENPQLTDPQFQKPEQEVFENLRIKFLQDDPISSCLPTDLTPIVITYLDQLMSDPVAGGVYGNYIKLNRTLTLRDTSEQYFGMNGEYTKLVQKRIRELERFWDMKGELKVKGQHTETLNDRDKLAEYFYSISYDESQWEDAYLMADDYIENNKLSPYLPESPLLAGDGFTNYDNTIVLGDGLIQILSETGIDPEIIWTGILAHEWAHQIQISNAGPWYDSAPPFLEVPLIKLELEADFFAAYFLTHKRGATYNWKRTEQFLSLFFQSGDCAVDNPGHHGTPAQRMAASRLGYYLADSARKKGQVLTPEEIHNAFEALLPNILNGSIQ